VVLSAHVASELVAHDVARRHAERVLTISAPHNLDQLDDAQLLARDRSASASSRVAQIPYGASSPQNNANTGSLIA
jgi:hypothetical protein